MTAVARDPAAPWARERRFDLSLTLVVFAAGAGSLATEIGAARLLAPYYGSSTIVWANVIGLVLASLALGYWLGGRLADRRPNARLLGLLVVAAALAVAAIPFISKPFLDVTVEGLDEVSAGAAIGSFFAVLALFAPPVTLLCMVAPFAVRLGVTEVATAGSVAGRLYAVSTVGSLLGTFLSALVAIPAIGTQRTLIASAVLIALGGALVLGPRWLGVAVGVAALAAIPPGAVRARDAIVYERESRYQFVQVVESDGARRLYLDEGLATHSVWRADTVLTGGIWDTFLAVPPLLGRPVQRVAILGNAGGTTARAFAVFYPDAEIDGVELDPAVTAVGRRYLGLGDNPRLRVHTADARPFLRRTGERYDLVFVDAYRPPYVPFYLATREFFRLVRERLRPGGIVALNVATVPSDHGLVDGIGGTLAREFPQVAGWQALRFNQLVLGFTEPLGRGEAAKRLARAPGPLRELTALLAAGMRRIEPSADSWTDDRSPVEWVTDRMIVEWAAESGEFDERPLPTAP
ncbi:MAG: fused MFS/spermidine synthase [Actinomycetota bacterium]|nr:fused MFS/spermidine synthase [Actinomycetota bacterium]